jgi:hypothetical protein
MHIVIEFVADTTEMVNFMLDLAETAAKKDINFKVHESELHENAA